MNKQKDDDFIIDTRKRNVKVTNNEEFAINVLRSIFKYRYYLLCFFVGLFLGLLI